MSEDYRNTSGLIPFKPGQSGNPKGKKPGTKNRSTLYRQFLDAVYKDKDGNMVYHTEGDDIGKPLTIGEMLALKTIEKGIEGSIKHTTEAFDSAYGKNPDKIEHSGLDGTPIETVNLTPEEAYQMALKRQ